MLIFRNPNCPSTCYIVSNMTQHEKTFTLWRFGSCKKKIAFI
uniref:Uncharacterized protein n=1 Tax=Rhizophora mucronata TaxID=61149 RepID=A0A2P2N1X2_RHIMU